MQMQLSAVSFAGFPIFSPQFRLFIFFKPLKASIDLEKILTRPGMVKYKRWLIIHYPDGGKRTEPLSKLKIY
ncbi:hypothetical protein JMW84_21520 [Klebsiella pneumoniae]|nr:hypothetical protein JMW84_21520 [Klebsiella pneumoniae]